MARELDPDKVDEYIEQNFEMEEYRNIMDRYYALMENYPDVIYMYVYRFTDEGWRVVFDLDSENGLAADLPGSIYEVDDAFIPYAEELLVGEYVPALWDHTKYGYLLTYVRPIFDSDGNYQCHACVDFSMDYLHQQDVQFVARLAGILIAAVLVILLSDIHQIRKRITGPLNRMELCTRSFKFDTEEDRVRNIQGLMELDINTHDEIEHLYEASLSVMKALPRYSNGQMKRCTQKSSNSKPKTAAIDNYCEKQCIKNGVLSGQVRCELRF